MPTFRLLGPFEVRDPLGTPLALPRRKQRELLALLLLRAGAIVGVDEIAAALWGDRPPASARANLHSYVSGLRAMLAGVAPTPERRPRSVPGGYQLDLAPRECDLAVFEDLAGAGRRALGAGQPAQAAEALARALGLWRGAALEGLGGAAWLEPFAARFEEARLRALEDQAEARLLLGQHEELVAELAAASARHPLRERLTGQHMRALAGAGRRPEALQAYNRAAELLEVELGVEPGPHLRRLHRRIRVGDVGGPGDGGHPAPALLPPDIPTSPGAGTR